MKQSPLSPVLPSERKFGFTFVLVFVIGGCYEFYAAAYTFAFGLFSLAALVLILALVFPLSLRRPNELWFELGLLIGRVTSPIVLGLIFFALVTPVALAMRMIGRDVFRLRPRRNVLSYWIQRDPVGPPPESFKNQY